MTQRKYNGFTPPRPGAGLKKGDGPAGCLVGLLFLLVLVAVVILSGLLTLLAWNVGVVGIAAATGGSVGKISLGIAICVNIAIGIVARIFRGRSPAATS